MKELFISLSFILLVASLNGQNKDIYESIHLDLNDQFHIVGESILATAFCRSEKTGKLSDLSKVLYVEINGPEGFTLKRKIALEKGVGQDEIFLNSSIPTGQYSLIAYTRWMRNTGDYFEIPIVIINPFETLNSDNSTKLTVSAKTDQPKHVFKKRSIEKLPLDIPDGHFSVSLKRKNEFVAFDLPKGEMVLNSSKRINSDRFTYLPEVRNEILEGKILDSINAPIPNVHLTMTIKSAETNLVATKSDVNGNFLFHFKSASRLSKFYITAPQLLTSFKIELKDEFVNKSLEKLVTNSISLDSFQRKKIVEKSIRNQIENAYLDAKAAKENSKLSIEQIINYDRTYNLDDYTRFPSLPETFIEYVPSVGVSRKRIPVFRVSQEIQDNRFDKFPLILLDGVPVDSRKLLTYSAQEVQSINIIRNRFYLGALAADGVLSIKTFTGQLPSFKLNSSIHQGELIPISNPTHEFCPQIPKRKDRAPDQREQLYWNPNFNSSLMKQIEFTTSDVPGDYLLKITGITDNGEIYNDSILVQVQ